MATFNMGLTKNATKSDDTVLPNFNFVMVGTAGDVTVTLAGGELHTITDVQANAYIAVGNAIKLMSTGTTALNIKVL